MFIAYGYQNYQLSGNYIAYMTKMDFWWTFGTVLLGKT